MFDVFRSFVDVQRVPVGIFLMITILTLFRIFLFRFQRILVFCCCMLGIYRCVLGILCYFLDLR